MATQRKKTTTPKKVIITKTSSATSKITEFLLLLLTIYIVAAVYEAVLNPFLWSFPIRDAAGIWLLVGFFLLLFFKWK